MSAPGQTPGPWRYLKADGEIVHDHDDRGAMAIAWSDADYTLAAAAPELLEALVRLTDSHARLENARGSVVGTLTANARAVIAKAEGRQ